MEVEGKGGVVQSRCFQSGALSHSKFGLDQIYDRSPNPQDFWVCASWSKLSTTFNDIDRRSLLHIFVKLLGLFQDTMATAGSVSLYYLLEMLV